MAEKATKKAANTHNTPKKVHNMMYVQQLRHLPDGTIDELIKRIETQIRPQEYAAIVHDKDPGEEPHIHCMFHFRNARSLKNVAKLLGEKGKEQQIEKWDGKANNGYAYLIHATAKARKEGKFQYNPKEVVANFDFSTRIAEAQKEVEAAQGEQNGAAKVTDMLNMLYMGAISKKEVERQLTGAQYAHYRRQIEDVWSKCLQSQAERWREAQKAEGAETKTIWIYGTAGAGKTRLAKEYAQKSGEEYYVSGSSNDPFQRYAGEHKLILDELRPGVIAYQDLLRITDPHGIEGEIMAPSRYYDKALACDLIIITSPYDPWEYYAKI